MRGCRLKSRRQPERPMSLSFVRCGEHNRGGWAWQVLEREAVTDAAVEVRTFGIGLQELLIASGRDLEIEIALSVAELDFKTALERIVEGRSQSGGFQRHAHRGL